MYKLRAYLVKLLRFLVFIELVCLKIVTYFI